MSSPPRILAFSGSTRTASFNHRLVETAAAASRNAGAAVTLISLRDFPMPLFDEDLEKSQGDPEAARRFRKLLVEHDGFLIASPEYNSSITAVLKNAIDWASRQGPDNAPLAAFTGKVAAILSASPGTLGGLRGLVHLRAILGNINVLVIPDQFALPKAHEAFNPDGSLRDPRHVAAVERVAAALTRTVSRLSA